MLTKSKKEIIVIIVAVLICNLIIFGIESTRAQIKVNHANIGYDAYTDEEASENRIITKKEIFKESLQENFQKDWPVELLANVLVAFTTMYVQKRRNRCKS